MSRSALAYVSHSSVKAYVILGCETLCRTAMLISFYPDGVHDRWYIMFLYVYGCT